MVLEALNSRNYDNSAGSTLTTITGTRRTWLEPENKILKNDMRNEIKIFASNYIIEGNMNAINKTS